MALRRSVSILTAVSLMLLGLTMVNAECPNGCSGNGDCQAKDMCLCYKNYQGNDCSERTCLFAYAHVDTPRGDLNMDGNRKSYSITAGLDSLILQNSQQSPYGTYEYFNPTAAANEAHFYLECANKGICDRATGLCSCFDGYEGAGCMRTTCPNKCSGHGVCQNIRQFGEKAGGGTLFGNKAPAGSFSYDLWDANSTYGCRCDPWYGGPDCSRRQCKVGVDPLFLSAGYVTYETFAIHVFDTETTAPAATGGTLRLRMFDYYGESYLTDMISFTDGAAAANAANVAAAIKKLPNQVFKTITCETSGSQTAISNVKSVRTATTKGMSVICQLVDNPGRIRLPEIVSFTVTGVVLLAKGFVTTTNIQGSNDEWFTTKSTLQVATTATTSTSSKEWAQVGATPDLVTTIFGSTSVPQLIKLGSNIVLADRASVALNLKLIFPLPATLASIDTYVFTADSPTTVVVAAVAEALTANVALGDTTLTFGTTTSPALVPGDLIFYHNQFFYVQSVYQSTNWYVALDRPFGGNSLDGGAGDYTAYATVYKVTPPDYIKVYNYVSPCSGRGMCIAETGVCSCFKGYTNDNCNVQSILAV